MTTRDILVIGGSAGALEPLQQIVAQLPASLPAAVFVVLHIGAHKSLLPQLLNRSGSMHAQHAVHDERIEHGRIYVAPPDHHLLIDNVKTKLARGAKENHARPAIDPLFRSAAVSAGPRTVALLLSGELDDGTAGLRAVRRCGGVTVVQDPMEAKSPNMPLSALEQGVAQHCWPLSDVIANLVQILGAPVDVKNHAGSQDPELLIETDMTRRASASIEELEKIGEKSPVTCPECGGGLWLIKEDALVRYRCHTGHALSAQTLMALQNEQLEAALYAAVRMLNEKEQTAMTMYRGARERSDLQAAQHFETRAERAATHSAQLQALAKMIRSFRVAEGAEDMAHS